MTIELRNMLGVLIKTIVDKVPQTSGDYKLVQNVQDLPPGIFMATLKLTSVRSANDTYDQNGEKSLNHTWKRGGQPPRFF